MQFQEIYQYITKDYTTVYINNYMEITCLESVTAQQSSWGKICSFLKLKKKKEVTDKYLSLLHFMNMKLAG